jgi:hypothetical protein
MDYGLGCGNQKFIEITLSLKLKMLRGFFTFQIWKTNQIVFPYICDYYKGKSSEGKDFYTEEHYE